MVIKRQTGQSWEVRHVQVARYDRILDAGRERTARWYCLTMTMNNTQRDTAPQPKDYARLLKNCFGDVAAAPSEEYPERYNVRGSDGLHFIAELRKVTS
jgi:hypothetical protein